MWQENCCSQQKRPLLGRSPILKRHLQQPPIVNIVLADDDTDEQYFFEVAVKELPVAAKVTVVHDGVFLIDHLIRTQAQPPDIVFLDIIMPRKNGIECLMEIKGNEQLKAIPIIMYSTCMVEAYIEQAFEYGALYFLQKGNYAELKASITKLLSLIGESPKQGSKEEFRFKLGG